MIQVDAIKALGAAYTAKGLCSFRVWAPLKDRMFLHVVQPGEKKIEMQKDEWGYFVLELEPPGFPLRYFYRPDDTEDYPDPASHFQPEGVHGPSELVNHRAFAWTDAQWKGLPFGDLILYELHVGTFTPEGTFDAIIPRLRDLADAGINAIELMPVSQFPGTRNWGYDGVYPYAVQHSYGGPEGLKRLVDACHRQGIAVFLDVVYNHLGPEGNYLRQFAPYFTDKYKTPWGESLNFDGEWSDGVREYFAGNPIHWFGNYHIDGLRCDAVHEMVDQGAVHFWEFCQERIQAFRRREGREVYLIAESNINSPKAIKPVDLGGHGFAAQWLDDFHHALYVLLDSKGRGRYADFGSMQQMAKAYVEGFVHTGEYVAFRKRRFGTSSAGIPGDKFVVFNQNHDQVGNRALAERLSVLVDFERLKLAAAALLLSPYVPMLFMGEEYGDDAPFFYFVDHSDPGLIKAVQEGWKKEFESFHWEADPPDPQDPSTFSRSRLQWALRGEGKHRLLLAWHKRLIGLRRTHPVLQNFRKEGVRADVLENKGLALQRQSEDGARCLLLLFNFSEEPVPFVFPAFGEKWEKRLDSRDAEWLVAEEMAGAVYSGDAVPQGIRPGQGGADPAEGHPAQPEEAFRVLPLSVCVYEASRTLRPASSSG